jgi:hypothetical protein
MYKYAGKERLSLCTLCNTIRRLNEPKSAKIKTYNSGYSLVVTHLTTNPPVRCLNRAERTGSLVFNVLWSYVKIVVVANIYIVMQNLHLFDITVVLETAMRRMHTTQPRIRYRARATSKIHSKVRAGAFYKSNGRDEPTEVISLWPSRC